MPKDSNREELKKKLHQKIEDKRNFQNDPHKLTIYPESSPMGKMLSHSNRKRRLCRLLEKTNDQGLTKIES